MNNAYRFLYQPGSKSHAKKALLQANLTSVLFSDLLLLHKGYLVV